MRFIHTADIHLASRMDSKFPQDLAKTRKQELRNTFRNMVQYARENDVTAIIMAGDVFDSDTPAERDKKFFYSVIENNPDVDFLYLKGNHDKASLSEQTFDNLKTFDKQWRSYRYGDVVISGIESSPENAISAYSSLTLPKDAVNIVVMHGQIADNPAPDAVVLRRLRDKNIDYLALGHVHKRQDGKIDGRGEYAYCGCLEGRGFDETGEHGFLLLDVENGKVTRTFVPFAERTVWEYSADVTGARDDYFAYLKVKEQVKFNKKDIYRVILKGQLDSEVDLSAAQIERLLTADCLFADVKDKTEAQLDWESFSGDASLKGEFVRLICADDQLSEEQKKRVAVLGLKALKGEKAEL